jgi:hypothetical protein
MTARYNNPALREEPRTQRAKIISANEQESLYNWLQRTGRFKSGEFDPLHNEKVPEELEDIMEADLYNLPKEEEEEEEFEL